MKYDIDYIIHIIKTENISKLREINFQNINLNTVDKNGKLPLQYAIISNNLEIVDILLYEGADVNYQDKMGMPILVDAIISNNYKVVKLLIDNGASISKEFGFIKESSLFFAVSIGVLRKIACYYQHSSHTLKAFKSLLRTQVNALKEYISNYKFDTLNTQIDNYIQYLLNVKEDPQILEYIITIATKEDIQIKNQAGVDLIDLLVAYGNKELLIYAKKKGVDFGRIDNLGRNLFFKVDFNSNYVEIVKYLLEIGLDINQTDIFGQNLLFYLINFKSNYTTEDSVCLISELVNLGVNIETQNIDGENIFHTRIATSIFCNQFNSYCGNESGLNDFIFEIKNKILNDAERINLEKEIMVKIVQNFDNLKSIDYIEITDYSLLIKQLCETNLNAYRLVNSKNKQGIPLFVYLLLDNNEYLLSNFINNNYLDYYMTDSEGMNFVHYCIVFQKIKLLRKGINKCNNIKSLDIYGRNILHQAVLYGNCEIVEIVLQTFNEVNNSDIYKLTPVHYAIMSNDISSFFMLTKAQIDYKIRDQYGSSYYELSLKYKCDDGIIDYLKLKHEGLPKKIENAISIEKQQNNIISRYKFLTTIKEKCLSALYEALGAIEATQGLAARQSTTINVKAKNLIISEQYYDYGSTVKVGNISPKDSITKIQKKECLDVKIDDVKIGIITALPKEFAAVKVLLRNCQEVYFKGKGAGHRYFIGETDSADNCCNYVALGMSNMGNNQASIRATDMILHFPNLESIIMTGIAGGVPFPEKTDEHVRLGDIVVSDEKGVVQYDYVKETEEFTFIRCSPRSPSAELLEAVNLLKALEYEKIFPWHKHLEISLEKLGISRPSDDKDILYSNGGEIICHPVDTQRKGYPKATQGGIASANVLLKNPLRRDSLREKYGIKAVEMESSGIADATWNHSIGYLVIRGICDYCDVHKNDDWQDYAACVAAAYTITLIEKMPAL